MAFYFKFATEGHITIAGRTIKIGEGGLLDVELSDAEKEFMRKSHCFREEQSPVEPAPSSKGAGSPSSEKVEKKSAPKKAAAKKPAAKKPAAKKKSAPKKKGA